MSNIQYMHNNIMYLNVKIRFWDIFYIYFYLSLISYSQFTFISSSNLSLYLFYVYLVFICIIKYMINIIYLLNNI